MLPTKFRIIWPCSFRGEEFKKSANQKQESPVMAMFVNGSGRNEQSFSDHLVKQLQKRRIFKISQSETSHLWWPCLLTDRDKMSILYRGPSIDASYQVSVHMAEGFQRRLKCEKLTNDRQQVMAKVHIAFGKVS
jgi:hypothetical protein